MSAGVDLANTLPRQMGVELGRTDTRMSEQLLNDAQVGPALEKVRGERVAERVRADPIAQPGPPGRGADGGECLLARQPPAAIAEEQWAAPFRADATESQQ